MHGPLIRVEKAELEELKEKTPSKFSVSRSAHSLSLERRYVLSLVPSLEEVPPFFIIKIYFRIQETHYCGGWSHLGLEHSISLSLGDVLHLYQLHWYILLPIYITLGPFW